jgi:DNA-binding transcriptional ArsR family regulator
MPVSAETFKALADPTRLALFELLLERPQRVTELVRRAAIPQPNVSRHLRILKDSGLVVDRREGRTVEYRVAGGKGSATDLLRDWAARVAGGSAPAARAEIPKPARSGRETATFVVHKPDDAFDSYLL